MSDPTPERAVEVERRLGVLHELIEDQGAGGALLALRHNFAWTTVGGLNHVATNSEQGAASLLITPREAVVLAPVNEAARIADEEVGGLSIEVVSLPWHETGATEKEARRRTSGDVLDDAALEEELRTARSALSMIDHDRLAVIADHVHAAVDATTASVQASVSEQEVAGRLVARLGSAGIRAPVLLAAADDRIVRYRHPLSTARAVRARLMLVVVAERWGLHVALTRFVELEPPEPGVVERFAALRTVQQAMTDATRAGRTLGDVIASAQRAYAEVGFPDEWRLHHQGGVIGYRPRERVATLDDPTPIREGMAFAWNPSLAGVKLEETVRLEADGEVRSLTSGATA